MARTTILGHTLAVVWFGVLASALRDNPNPDMEQREVTFDLADIWGFEGPDMGQKEISEDLLAELGFTEVQPANPSGPAMFSPRGAPPRVVFPPGQPTAQNLQAICLQGGSRPRYPQGTLPSTGFSHLSRQADAIHRVEAWYGQQCCQGDWQQHVDRTLCCTRQAWREALHQFCEDEFGIKTRHYHCCNLRKKARWACFEREAPNPSYQPSRPYSGPNVPPRHTPVFTFNNSTCSRTGNEAKGVLPRALKGSNGTETSIPDIIFPPARPSASNIRHVCKLRKARPLYNAGCLPRGGYGWLARQAKSANRLERGYKSCCKGKVKVLACATQKWEEEMKRFCGDEHVAKAKKDQCCAEKGAQKQLACLASKAPDQDYMDPMLQRELTHDTPHPRRICDTHKILKKLQVKLPVDAMVKKCCHLEDVEKVACLTDTMTEFQEEQCKVQPPSTVSASECRGPNQAKCLSDLLTKSIAKAMKTKGFSRRRCPLKRLH
ncbi:extracellular matrix protein 1-like [Engraulis encrasicolus]|uniref:extracellular matrix protein 1-like n=1 Tax=Engraulis encrasicolus TaxID=184585 RepID=UPI002FD02A20